MIIKAFKYEIKPTPEQQQRMLSWFGVSRFFWNWTHRTMLDWVAANKDLPKEEKSPKPLPQGAGDRSLYKVFNNRLGANPEFPEKEQWSEGLVQAILDCPASSRTAVFKSYFQAEKEAWKKNPGGKQKRKNGTLKFFPRFHGKDGRGSISFQIQRQPTVEPWKIKLPKIGWLRTKENTRKLRGTVKNATLSFVAGKFFVSLQVRIEEELPAKKEGPSVGIDLGVNKFIVSSEGEILEGANALDKKLKKLARLNRQLARKRREAEKDGRNPWDSARYRKKIFELRKLNYQISCARKDAIHKASSKLCKRGGHVFMEDLSVSNMTKSAKGTVEEPGKNVAQKAGLNRRILDQGWHMLSQQMAYKSEWHGSEVMMVPPQYTSKTCSHCGMVKEDLKLSDRVFKCGSCGLEMDRDENAARNIRARGIELKNNPPKRAKRRKKKAKTG